MCPTEQDHTPSQPAAVYIRGRLHPPRNRGRDEGGIILVNTPFLEASLPSPVRRRTRLGGETMRMAGLVAFVGIAALSLLVPSAPAAAADCKALVKPSPFGPDDQTGATNRVTPAVTKAAAAEIQTGVVTSMSNVLVDGIPLFGTRFSKTILSSFAITPGAEFGNNKLTYMEDTYLSQSHVGTHIDGVGHIGIQDCYYNQTPIGKYVTQNYMKRLGIENMKSFATRGVIIYMVKVFQNPGKEESIAFPVHKTMITDNGIHLVENVRTDLIAAEAAKTGRATFFLNMTVPKAVGLTGTFVNIEAIQ